MIKARFDSFLGCLLIGNRYLFTILTLPSCPVPHRRGFCCTNDSRDRTRRSGKSSDSGSPGRGPHFSCPRPSYTQPHTPAAAASSLWTHWHCSPPLYSSTAVVLGPLVLQRHWCLESLSAATRERESDLELADIRESTRLAAGLQIE